MVVFTPSLETLRAAFTEIKINKIMSAEQRRKDMKLLSAFLFVSCIYALNVHGIGEKFIQLRFVFHDSLYLNITPLETLLVDAGADPGFFLGGGALVSCSTSTPINHIVFFLQNTSCIRKPQVISGGGGGGCAPPAPSP